MEPEHICKRAKGIGRTFPINETAIANIKTLIKRPIRKPKQTFRLVV
jgi:hypothetical protein